MASVGTLIDEAEGIGCAPGDMYAGAGDADW